MDFPFDLENGSHVCPSRTFPANSAARSLATTSTVPKHEESDWTVSVEVEISGDYDWAVRDTEI